MCSKQGNSLQNISSHYTSNMPQQPFHDSDSDQSEDSDAEFLVHPILRGLIKSKSAYSMPKQTPRLKTSKTVFEINLSKMWESTMDDEATVADFIPDLDQKWPEPDVPKSPSTKQIHRSNPCWSSPPNVSAEEPPDLHSSQDEYKCWSAPKGMDNDEERDEGSSEIEHDHVPGCCSCHEIELNMRESTIPFLNSYPAIDADQVDESVAAGPPLTTSALLLSVPSLSSIRLPSSSCTSAESPSPPRPLSPVLGEPPTRAARISGSRSMQLRPRPELSSLVSNSTSDDDSPQQDPWPQQEVWPEEDVMSRSLRTGWTSADPMRPQSSRAQSERGPRPQGFSSSQSMHSPLTQSTPSQQDGSSQPYLDEFERRDLITRSAWIDRGSSIQLHAEVLEHSKHEAAKGTTVFGSDHRCESHSDFRSDPETSDQMRRSYTTEELKRERRKLPKRPDVQPFFGDLPPSNALRNPNLCGISEKTTKGEDDLYFPTQPKELRPSTSKEEPITGHEGLTRMQEHMATKRIIHGPFLLSSLSALTRPLDSRVVQKSYNTRPITLRVSGPLRQHATSDAYEPPTPVNVNLSPPQLTGRRLPLLPVSLVGHYPAMSLPQQNVSKPQDHTLCFIDGMTDSMMGRSAFEDSYYEEDGLNGNSHVKPRRSFFSPDDSSGVSSCTTSDSMNPTHRVQSAFIPRHSDEVLLDIGDAVHVDRTCEDHWCYGTNLRTGMSGIFPSAVVCEIDIVEEICLGALPSNANKMTESERDTFYLTMLASIEVGHHKGNDVLVQAMNKVLSMYKNHEEIIVPQTVLMEVSFRGIHVIDKRRKNFFQCPTFDFFYSLQNISFCGAHPKQLKYFGFITKHPLLPRFACHVFLSSSSTQPIVESIGRAFKRSYDEYMAFAHPTEDIYLE